LKSRSRRSFNTPLTGKHKDAGADTGLGVAALGFTGDAGDELGLAHRAQGFRAGLPIGVPALQENRGHDVVARADIGKQFVEEVAALAVPQMVMRIDDRQRRLDDVLAMLGKPRRVEMAVGDLGSSALMPRSAQRRRRWSCGASRAAPVDRRVSPGAWCSGCPTAAHHRSPSGGGRRTAAGRRTRRARR
jgi:hypothetical protein